MGEKELIQKSLRGDESAINDLFAQNKDSVFRHCLRIVKNEEIAQDLTQEAFVHAFKHLASFRMESSFSTWLWRIAHNLALNYIKKRRFFEQEFKEELLLPNFLEAKSRDDELLSKISQVLPQLSHKQRTVFEMYDLKRIPQKEIASILGISLGTVRSRLFYARKKIKKLLQESSSSSLR